MTFHIITIFPEIFNSYFNESIIKRAQEAGKIDIKIYNLRDWTSDKHRSVDDVPYGGGAGMIMKVEPLYRAIKHLSHITQHTTHFVLTSAKGDKWTQQKAEEFKKLDNIVIICGRYEGVDERVLNFVDEEISIGDYVLTGGEIPAMVMVDSISRLIPGVLGNAESLKEESHSIKIQNPKPEKSRRDLGSYTGSKIKNLEYPQYTRPEVFVDDEDREYKVPEILLSGNHKEIEKWRLEKMKPKSPSPTS
jgi:tRNA (guanine37-N1)-methyltransferase